MHRVSNVTRFYAVIVFIVHVFRITQRHGANIWDNLADCRTSITIKWMSMSSKYANLREVNMSTVP